MLRRSDTVIVVIGTPVDEFLNPSMTVFERAVDQIAPHLRDGASVVLRSTVYPGTTEYVAGQPGGARLPRRRGVLPGADRRGPCARGARQPAPDHRRRRRRRRRPRRGSSGGSALKVVRTTTKEAELAKLFTNTWRYMKFAVANQFFMIAHQAGVDYTNVLQAIREDYPRAADLPGPGFAAGPCLFKDTMQLAAFTSDHFPMGQAAMQVNEGLPAYIVSALERRYGSLRGRTVGILGMAFKAESDDTRASLSFKLRKLLAWAGATVLCTDPYVVDDRLRAARAGPRRERHRHPGRSAPGVPRPRARRPRRGRHLGRPRRRDPAVKVLVTGAAGFICGYLVPELLERGHEVVGRRQLQQVRPAREVVRRPSRYRFVEGDAKDVALLTELAADCDQVVAAAAMIGGISYFHEFAYDLLAENERILAATFDAAIAAHRAGRLERIVVVIELVDGLRVGDRLPDAGGRPAHEPAAGLDLRLPEARQRVLREGRPRAVRPAVHDPAAVQLRRHRRAAGRARHGRDERQRQARR